MGVLRSIRLRIAPAVTEAAFVAFLLLVFVGLTPFSPPVVTDISGAVPGAGAGDALRQILYLAVFAILLLSALQKRGLGAIGTMPILLALLLAWCATSALWAAAPGVAFRRAGLEIVLVLSVMLGVDALGWERSLSLWRWVLAGVLVVNWISIPLIHTAVHNSGEIDPSLVGDWRGLYGHKNIAGAVCALTVILFLWSAVETKSLRDAGIALLAFGFLVMTRSKSSLGLLPVALVAGAAYRFAWQRSIDRAIVLVTAAILLGALAILIAIDANAIARVLEDPNQFTGRAAIWQAELAYIHDHPVFGAGFGTFADTGGLSPLRNYVADNGDWVKAVSHGHSGYLQLLVTIGGVGFLLTFAALIVYPLFSFWRIEPERVAFKTLLISIYVFFVLHNVMESDFLEGDAQGWVAFLLMLAMLGSADRETRRAKARDTVAWSP